MKKGLTFEMAGLLIVGIVFAIIGIGLVMQFMGIKSDIPAKIADSVNVVLRGSYVDSKNKLPVINASYTPERVAKHIKTCWDDTRSIEQDKPCAVLRGTFGGVDSTNILDSLSKIDLTAARHANITAAFDTTDMVLVFYDYSDDIIDVKS